MLRNPRRRVTPRAPQTSLPMPLVPVPAVRHALLWSRACAGRAAAGRVSRHVLRTVAGLWLAATAGCDGEQATAETSRAGGQGAPKAAEATGERARTEGGAAARESKAEPNEGGAAEGGAAEGAAAEGAATDPTRVTLTEAGFATARVAVEPVQVETTGAAAGGLEVPGQVEFDPARVALISPRAAGRIERLLVVPGDRVQGGQTVALLFSPAFLTAQTDLQQARRRSDLLAGTADAGGARALLDAARRRLALLGATAAEIGGIERGRAPAALLPVRAPFAGSIIEATALAGAAVEAGAPLYRLADLSTVNVAAHVPEAALGALRVGQRAAIRVTALPGRPFAGTVRRISDQLDSTQRTVDALVQVSNTGRALKPGMFATVALTVPGAGRASPGTSILSVPETAVVTDGEARYVFVEVGPRAYERRAVELAPGPRAGGLQGGRVVVVSGLRQGERVVTRGAFALKSELTKGAFAEDEG